MSLYYEFFIQSRYKFLIRSMIFHIFSGVLCFLLLCVFPTTPHSLQDLSSPANNWTQATTVKAPTPKHCTTREFPVYVLKYNYINVILYIFIFYIFTYFYTNVHIILANTSKVESIKVLPSTVWKWSVT